MNGSAVVLDSGVLDRVVTSTVVRAMVAELRSRGFVPIVPAVVLTEALTGTPRDAAVNLVLRHLDHTTTTDERTARRAGSMRYLATRQSDAGAPSAIDALVAAHASGFERAVILTTDPADLARLTSADPSIAVLTASR